MKTEKKNTPTCKYPLDLFDRYDFRSYGHAMEILADAFPDEWKEIYDALAHFSITKAELKKAGGNKSPIPPKFDDALIPLGWEEIKITGDLHVKIYPRGGKKGTFSSKPFKEQTIKHWIDGHNIDFVKNRVAFDLEWNSKDQTFDRDLLAMRTYFDCGLIDVGIIVTRDEGLNEIFKSLGLMGKYGASTTWMGKLVPRLESRRNGGCPILAIGIKKKCVADWKEKNEQQG